MPHFISCHNSPCKALRIPQTLPFPEQDFPCSQDSGRLLPLNRMAQLYLADPSRNILLNWHAPAHIQLLCKASSLSMVQISTMRTQEQGSREAADKVVDHGAKWRRSESCLYNVVTSSVILDELFYFPMNQSAPQ